MANNILIVNTIKHLRLKQIYYQLYYRLFSHKLMEYNVPRQSSLRMVSVIAKWYCYNVPKTFTFLNLIGDFKSWNDVSHGMLWAYNLNYMDWLLQPDMTFEQGSEWVERFITDLPTNRIGLDPYPIALRSINWIKFIGRHHKKVESNRLQRWNDSLYAQCKLLERKLEYQLLGNHLLEDAYALFIASIYFSDKKMYDKASCLLYKELDEQILPDGSHYEQSPMYHCILLDRLLDCYNASINRGHEKMCELLKLYVVRMLGHLESIVWKDDTIPLLNDSAYGIAPTVSELRAYAKRLKLEWTPLPMKECGYRKLCSTHLEAVVDVGNITATYQPGHSHADTFNYELRIDCRPFVVDTGISTYNKTARRQYERSTSAHNTVTVGYKDSSEVWGGFRMGKRAKVRVLSDTENEIMAEHDGFKGCIHQRKFTINDDVFTINDKIVGNNMTECISYIHFAPDIEVLAISSTEIRTNRANIAVSGANSIEIINDFVSVEYNRLEPSKTIKIVFCRNLTYQIFQA